VELGNRDRCLEDADDNIVQGLFSFGSHQYVGPAGDSGTGQTFSPALFYIGDVPERSESRYPKDPERYHTIQKPVRDDGTISPVLPETGFGQRTQNGNK